MADAGANDAAADFGRVSRLKSGQIFGIRKIEAAPELPLEDVSAVRAPHLLFESTAEGLRRYQGLPECVEIGEAVATEDEAERIIDIIAYEFEDEE